LKFSEINDVSHLDELSRPGFSSSRSGRSDGIDLDRAKACMKKAGGV
jgi:hypothetical protein